MDKLEFGAPSDPFEPEQKKENTSEFDLSNISPAAIPDVSMGEAVNAQVFRPLTPRRMGEYLEKKMLPALDDMQQQAEADRQLKLGAATQELSNIDPWMQKALALTGSAANTATAGLFPYIPTGLAKGAGKLGIPGYERFADMPFFDIKKEAEKKLAAANTIEPGYGAAGTAGGILLGAKTLPAVAPSYGPAISGGLTGGTYGAISGGAAEGDIYDAMKGALVGTLGGAVAAPVIERTASGIMRLFTGGKPVVTSSGALTDEAIAAARAAGLTNNEITTLAPQLRQVFERRGVTPTAAAEARFQEFGIVPKRGMVSGDAAQLEREARFGNYAPQAQQAEAAAQAVAGGAQPSVRDAVANAVDAGNRQAAALQSAYTRAYGVAENTPGTFTRESITNLGEKIMQGLAIDPKNLSIIGNDAAKVAASKLDTFLGAAIPAGPGMSVIHRTFQGVESGRKLLNESLGAAATDADRRAVRRLIDEFDKKIENNINNGAFSGNPNVVNDWRAARKLYSEYQTRFGIRKTGEDAGKMMRSVLDGSKSADDVGNAMFNFAASGNADLKNQAIKTMLQLRRALGPNSPELDTIKRSYMQQVMTPRIPSAAGEAATNIGDFSRVATNIDKMLNGNGSAFSRRLLTNDERAAMARYANVMRQAGQLPPAEISSRLQAWGNVALMTAPAVVGVAATQLYPIDPTLAAVLSTVGSIPGGLRVIKGTAPIQTYRANQPPVSASRPYRFPAVRTAIPLGVTAAPSLEEDVKNIQQNYSNGDSEPRPNRASGGKVGHAHLVSRLMKLAEHAKKSSNKATEPLLNASDDHVVKALDVAQRAI